jgi:(E)-4-hydroxy-3-methylbut-2-enyl-diphosphate synthase
MNRKEKRVINVGPVKIGGKNPVVVQSMTKTDTRDVEATTAQIERLSGAGCRIVRVAVKGKEEASALSEIIKRSKTPIIADIHFDYRLAISAIEAGASGIRINPGNIGGEKKIREITDRVRGTDVAIRIGVNSGSIEKDILEKSKGPTPEAMVESAIRAIRIFEELGYTNIKLSLKSSNVIDTIDAYRMISEMTDYPLHLGITEAGTIFRGAVKSAVGLGILLSEGIGDTIRVSLSGDPIYEVIAAYSILSALGIGGWGTQVIACPTCGRTEVDIVSIAEEVEKRLIGCNLPITVAVMGCEVNGPGEAKEADIGICGGKGGCLLFKNGKILRKVKEGEILDALMEEIDKISEEKKGFSTHR